MSAPGEITVLLAAAQRGEPGAEEDLVALVYRELRGIARRQMARERADHTLQPTALVHETYLKLLQSGATVGDRAHFFAAASMVMRRILVDHARRKASLKRAGGVRKVSLEGIDPGVSPRHQQVLIVDQALRRLSEFDERKGKLVEMMYFGGLSEDEAALTLGLSTRTVRRDWQTARAWLHSELTRDRPELAMSAE